METILFCGKSVNILTHIFPHFFQNSVYAEVSVDPFRCSESGSADHDFQTMSSLGSLNTDQHSKNLEKCEDKRVCLLIECYMKCKDQLGKLANKFNRISDVLVTGDQCLQKWKKLELKQKEIEDNNNNTGRQKKACKSHKEMEDCLGPDNPSVKPVFIFETAGSSSSLSCSTPSSTPNLN